MGHPFSLSSQSFRNAASSGFVVLVTPALYFDASHPRGLAFILPDVIRHLRNQTPEDGWRFLFTGSRPRNLEP
jgi:hypothetical protein